MRWATVDPNPMAQKREARKIEEQAAEAVRRALPEEFVREIEGRDPDAKRRKRVEGGFGLEGYEAPDQVWYARSKELEGNNDARKAIEGEEGYLIEEAGEEKTAEENTADNGILSSSTVAALKNQASSNGGKIRMAGASTTAPAGPLVAYGSDDDDDSD